MPYAGRVPHNDGVDANGSSHPLRRVQADGIKWMGYLPKQRILYKLGRKNRA